MRILPLFHLYSGLRRPAIRRGITPVFCIAKQKYSAMERFDESKENTSLLFACKHSPRNSHNKHSVTKKKGRKTSSVYDNNR
jgi:hypothetical protein